MAEPIKNRYDFVFFFDVKNGNPTAIRMPATCPASTPHEPRHRVRRVPEAQDPQLRRPG